jgi:hypothetical protein
MSYEYKKGDFLTAPKGMFKVVNSPYTFTVLTNLIQFADDNGHCFPGQECLSGGIMCVKQVNRSARELEDKGFIHVNRKWIKGGGINLSYDVFIDKIVDAIKSLKELQSNGLPVQQTDIPLESNGQEVQRTTSPVQSSVSPVQSSVSPLQRTDSPNNDNQLTKTIKRKPSNKNHISTNNSFGSLLNVFLSNDDVTKLEEKFPNDWADKIEHLSLSIAQYGYEKRFKSHYATILKWAKDDEAKKAAGNNGGQNHGRPPIAVSSDDAGVEAVLASIENKQEVSN